MDHLYHGYVTNSQRVHMYDHRLIHHGLIDGLIIYNNTYTKVTITMINNSINNNDNDSNNDSINNNDGNSNDDKNKRWQRKSTEPTSLWMTVIYSQGMLKKALSGKKTGRKPTKHIMQRSIYNQCWDHQIISSNYKGSSINGSMVPNMLLSWCFTPQSHGFYCQGS